MGVELRRFDEPIYVICEGRADAALICRLVRREGLTGFSVNYTGGYQHFAARVAALRTSSDWKKLKRLVIVGDNDLRPRHRLNNARRALLNEELVAPDAPSTIVNGSPSTAIYMLPRANEPGALESLLMEAVLRERPGLGECLRTLDECAATDCRDWDAVKRAKMRFHTAVAVTCHDDPSAAATYIWSKRHKPASIESTVFNDLAEFLRRVAEV